VLLTHYKTGESVEVEVDLPLTQSSTLFYAPAFVDLQVNGYGGVDFSSAETLAEEDVPKVVKALWSQGVAYFFPTLITGSFETTRRSLELIDRSCHDPEIARSIAGVHLEGPYISPEEGPRGAHPANHVRPPDRLTWMSSTLGRRRLEGASDWSRSLQKCRGL